MPCFFGNVSKYFSMLDKNIIKGYNIVNVVTYLENESERYEMKSKSTVLAWMMYDVFALVIGLVASIMIGVNFSTSGWISLVQNMEKFLVIAVSAIIPNVLYLLFTKRYKVIWKYASPVDYIVLLMAPVFSFAIMITYSLFARLIGLPFLARKNVYVVFFVISVCVVVAPRVFLKL